MAKKIEIVGAKPKKIEIIDQPKRHIEPAELAAALGANPAGEQTAGNLDLIGLAEIGTQLLARLRSTGGRPALADATEICRVPLSAEDLKALEQITDQIAQTTGTRPSPGQVASIIVREYLTSGAARVQNSPSLTASMGAAPCRNHDQGEHAPEERQRPREHGPRDQGRHR
jgi:hypothetical protein